MRQKNLTAVNFFSQPSESTPGGARESVPHGAPRHTRLRWPAACYSASEEVHAMRYTQWLSEVDAERRTALDPTLWINAVLRGALVLMAVSVLAARAPAEDVDEGRALYLKYCSACHGADGKGDGIVATVLRPKPTDLTLLAKTHDGKFPRSRVQRSIDGRERVAAHGDTEMPVWGAILTKEKGTSVTTRAAVRGQVQLLTDYVQSIQVK